MGTISEVLNQWMEAQKVQVIADYESRNIKASGKFGRSLRVETKGNDSKLIGNDYIKYPLDGRTPNRNQTPEGIKAWVGWAGSTFIKQWVKDKGLSISPFAVAYSIAKKGFQRPGSDRRTDGQLLKSVFSPESFKELNKEIGMSYVLNFKSEIHKAWQSQ